MGKETRTKLNDHINRRLRQTQRHSRAMVSRQSAGARIASRETLTRLERIDEAPRFNETLESCQEIDIMLGTGMMLIGQYRDDLIQATHRGTRVQLIVLDPGSLAAEVAYGPGGKSLAKNAVQLTDWLGQLERKCRRGYFHLKLTTYPPPFSMFIAKYAREEYTHVRLQINPTFAATSSDRPSFRIPKSSQWFKVFESELNENWRTIEEESKAFDYRNALKKTRNR